MSENVLSSILTYLIDKPYKEVASLVLMVQTAPLIAEDVETPTDDKSQTTEENL